VRSALFGLATRGLRGGGGGGGGGSSSEASAEGSGGSGGDSEAAAAAAKTQPAYAWRALQVWTQQTRR
jgi:hypothetical protein